MTRVDQLQHAMGDVDAMVLRLAENVLLATGYWIQVGGLGFAIVPRRGEATLLIPEYETDEARAKWPGEMRTFPIIRFDGENTGEAISKHLKHLARAHKLEGGRIGYEGSFEALAPPTFTGEANSVALPTQQLLRTAFDTDQLDDVSAILETVRLEKTPNEIESLRVVNEVAAFGLRAFKEHAEPGRTEAEVAAAVDYAIVSKGHGHKGARVVRSYATVLSGPETWLGWQYFRHRNRRIEKDEVVMLELGTVVDGFWSDHTRTVVAGRATSRQREALAAVKAAQNAAFAACRPGAIASDVDAAARRTCESLGFHQFPHYSGHGVGFRYHESRPQFMPRSDHVISANMVVVVEPGIYEEGLGGFRWEDDAVVTADGAVRLVETPYELD